MTTNPQQRRCTICWNWFTVHPHAPQRRYCCGACRVADWRRRRTAEHLHTEPRHAPTKDSSDTMNPD